MNQVWERCEQYLKSQGAKEVFTDSSDPEFDDRGSWYSDFLARRGYKVVEQKVTGRSILRKEIKRTLERFAEG